MREPDLDDVPTVVASRFAEDELVLAVFLGGSRARGEADSFSDIDLCLVLADDAYEDVIAGREALVRRVGEPLFLEDFGRDDHRSCPTGPTSR